MNRASDWEHRLSVYLSGLAGAVFEYGRLDCCMFAADAVEVMTGEDLAAEFRGKYKSHAGSIKALRGVSLDEIMNAKLDSVSKASAMRGDIVMYENSLGVCMGKDALFVGEEGGLPGLVRQPVLKCQYAWRVPF